MHHCLHFRQWERSNAELAELEDKEDANAANDIDEQRGFW